MKFLLGHLRATICAHAELKLSFFSLQYNRLAVHTPHKVKGIFWFSAQGKLKYVFRNLPLHYLAQIMRHFKIAVCRTHSLNTLVGPAVVVMLDPHGNALSCSLKAVKLSAG